MWAGACRLTPLPATIDISNTNARTNSEGVSGALFSLLRFLFTRLRLSPDTHTHDLRKGGRM